MADHGQILVANAGTLHLFQLAAELRRHGLLQRCVTSLFFRSDAFRFLPPAVRDAVQTRTANRRRHDLDDAVTTRPYPELACLLAKWFGLGAEDAWIEWRNRRFCSWVAQHHLDDARLVWAFDTCSYELFVEAKRRRIPCVLDMSIAHPALGNRLIAEYRLKRPGLASCLEAATPSAALERRRAEIALADRVVVGSNFVRDSLLEEGIDAGKVTVNPYGVDLGMFAPRSRAGRSTVRFLFAGWLSARKGIYDLLDAWQRSELSTRNAELIVAGGTAHDLRCWIGPMPDGVTFAGRIAHARLPALYQSVDIFVFPSLFEGSARVILEAMASGLPVITTPQACDRDWVVDGDNGLRVPAGDPVTLAKTMDVLANDAGLRMQMGARAAARAGRYAWTAYGDRCAEICREVMASH